MDTFETMEMLRKTISEQEETIKREEERIQCLRERCGKSADLICLLNAQSMSNCPNESSDKNLERNLSEYSGKDSDEIIDENPNENLNENLLALATDDTIWPHIHCRMRINLREQLWELQVELKCLENKMLDGTRAQLRKWSIRMEEIRQLCERIEQALLSIESWEKMYLMFMDDMDIRRSFGMDERFYQMELQDIRQKMNTCSEFYETVRKEIEAAILLRNQEFGELECGKQEFEKRESEKPEFGAPDSAASLPEEIVTEIRRYAIGTLFLEDHVYKRGKAEEKRNLAERTLERMEEECENDKRRLSRMQFAY